MKHVLKIALLVFIVGLYSCHSTAQKIKKNSKGTFADKQSVHPIKSAAPSPEIDRDTSTQPLTTKIFFPDFSVKINNCVFNGYKDDNNKFIYSGDTITDKVDVRNYRMWTLTTKNDTVHLSTDDDMGLDIGTIEILPNNKTDRFEISYSFEVQIVAENGKGGILWQSMMPYKKIKDSLTYFFRAPEHNNMYSTIGSKIKEIKKKFNLKDTAFKKEAANHDYGIYTEDGVIFKNQLCEIPYIPIIYLKIDRFIGNKLTETKYLVVDFSIPE